jgi:hypothetical protein
MPGFFSQNRHRMVDNKSRCSTVRPLFPTGGKTPGKVSVFPVGKWNFPLNSGYFPPHKMVGKHLSFLPGEQKPPMWFSTGSFPQLIPHIILWKTVDN